MSLALKARQRAARRKGGTKERVFGCDLLEHLQQSGQDVPQVLRSCTEFVEQHGVVDGIYRLSGVSSNIQRLRQEFDGERCPELQKEIYLQDIHCVSSLCKAYFRELPNPLLTYQLYDKFADAVATQMEEARLVKIKEVLKELPVPHYRTLEFLMRHLLRMASYSSQTNMHARNLAIVWAPNLLRSRDIEVSGFNGTAAFMEVRVQSIVVEFILTHVEQLFGDAPLRAGETPRWPLLPGGGGPGDGQPPLYHVPGTLSQGDGPPPIRPYHTIIELGEHRRKGSLKAKKWRSIFHLGRSGHEGKRKLVKMEEKEERSLRPAKSMDSLSSLPPPSDETPQRSQRGEQQLQRRESFDVCPEPLQEPPQGREEPEGERGGPGSEPSTPRAPRAPGVAPGRSPKGAGGGRAERCGGVHISGPFSVTVPFHITANLSRLTRGLPCPALAQPAPESPGEEPSGAEPPGLESLGSDPPGLEPLGSEPPGLEPSGAEPPGLELLGVEPPGLEPSGAEPPGLEPLGSGPPGLELLGSGPPGLEPLGSGPPGLELLGSEPPGLEPSGAESPGLEPSGSEPPGLELSGEPLGPELPGSEPLGLKSLGPEPPGPHSARDPEGQPPGAGVAGPPGMLRARPPPSGDAEGTRLSLELRDSFAFLDSPETWLEGGGDAEPGTRSLPRDSGDGEGLLAMEEGLESGCMNPGEPPVEQPGSYLSIEECMDEEMFFMAPGGSDAEDQAGDTDSDDMFLSAHDELSPLVASLEALEQCPGEEVAPESLAPAHLGANGSATAPSPVEEEEEDEGQHPGDPTGALAEGGAPGQPAGKGGVGEEATDGGTGHNRTDSSAETGPGDEDGGATGHAEPAPIPDTSHGEEEEDGAAPEEPKEEEPQPPPGSPPAPQPEPAEPPVPGSAPEVIPEALPCSEGSVASPGSDPASPPPSPQPPELPSSPPAVLRRDGSAPARLAARTVRVQQARSVPVVPPKPQFAKIPSAPHPRPLSAASPGGEGDGAAAAEGQARGGRREGRREGWREGVSASFDEAVAAAVEQQRAQAPVRRIQTYGGNGAGEAAPVGPKALPFQTAPLRPRLLRPLSCTAAPEGEGSTRSRWSLARPAAQAEGAVGER